MPEHENREDLIERFFREKMEGYEIPFEEEDWNKLSKRLDLREQQQAASLQRRWMIAAAILIFSLLGFLIYQNYESIRRLDDKLAETVQKHQKSLSIKNHQKSQPSDTSRDDDSSGYVSSRPPRNKKNKLGSGPAGFVSHVYQLTDAHLLTEKSVQGIELVPAPSCPGCETTTKSIGDKRAKSDVLPTLARSDHHKHLQAASPPLMIAGLQSSHSYPDFLSRFSIGMAFSPDLSSVGAVSNFTEPGYKFGVTLEYALSSRWALSVGSILSKVNYIARGQDYKPPTGFWTNGIVPYQTDGQCLLIDLPISLRYNFYRWSDSKLYAAAGVASYVMLNEDYQFDYSGYYSGMVQGWSGKTGNAYWLSNASFSVGYEHELFNNVKLRAEPFIRVPIKEVGWGNVKLYSIGSFISINYSLR